MAVLSLEDFKKLSEFKQKSLHVSFWGGDVVITQLSNAFLLNLQEKYTDTQSLEYVLDIVTAGMVEPKLSKEDLLNISDGFKGVSFVCESILNFSTNSKK